MTATTKADSDDGYQHWGDDGDFLKSAPASVAGYDTHNGLRSHLYEPAYDDDDKSTIVSVKTAKTEKSKKAESPKSAPAPPPQPQVVYALPPHYQYPQMMTYPPGAMQYTYAAPPQQFYHPMPPQPGYYGYHPGMMPVPMVVPAPAPKPEYKPPKAAKWQGRTKKQVEEDNMKIAAREGACEKRKVKPVGVKEEQMMWCVETDGSTTLR
ncbi:hypothetical protein EJ03DRAFT_328052 [Teratosphaeria nubilosa]|uniref:Uncharacterized protein n=1 Tax=Teratosphaeria nubilosa TaxID=161662 RepID=A0A6G1L8J9_9PEZI|nr:hypothetical protein EJ03DRAFT_328052 [Teratosphaeria nubilosa]